jgi:hypothetical protein
VQLPSSTVWGKRERTMTSSVLSSKGSDSAPVALKRTLLMKVPLVDLKSLV